MHRQAVTAAGVELVRFARHCELIRGEWIAMRPIAEVAKKAIGVDRFQIVVDAGCSNAEQAARGEAAGMLPHVPAMCTANNQGDGRLHCRQRFRFRA
jgi:hypothetical protein